jgi:hypothetical protein
LSQGFGLGGGEIGGIRLGEGLGLGDLMAQYGQMLNASMSAGHDFEASLGGGADAISGALGGAGGQRDTTGFHELDLTTDQAKISALVSEKTMDTIRRSAIGARITSTGPKQSWYGGGF